MCLCVYVPVTEYLCVPVRVCVCVSVLGDSVVGGGVTCMDVACVALDPNVPSEKKLFLAYGDEKGFVTVLELLPQLLAVGATLCAARRVRPCCCPCDRPFGQLSVCLPCAVCDCPSACVTLCLFG